MFANAMNTMKDNLMSSMMMKVSQKPHEIRTDLVMLDRVKIKMRTW